MSENSEKIQRCIISGLVYDEKLHLVTCDAELAGKLQKGTEKTGIEWAISIVRTKLSIKAVPLRELLVKLFVGWFWVRVIQDTLRKGTKAEALAAMSKGYDWSESMSREARIASPAELGSRAIAAMTSAEQINEMIRLATAKLAELGATEQTAEQDKGE